MTHATAADDDMDDDDTSQQSNTHVLGRSARTDRHGQLRSPLVVTVDTTPPHRVGRSSRTSSTFTRTTAHDDDDDDAQYASPSRPDMEEEEEEEELDVPHPRVSRRPHDDDGDADEEEEEDADGDDDAGVDNPIIPPHTLVEEPYFSFAKSKHVAPMPQVSSAMRVTHHTSTATAPIRIGATPAMSIATPTSPSTSSSRAAQPFSLPIRMSGPLGSKQFRRVEE